MSALGDLLELLHGAADRWTTVSTTARIWRQNDLAKRARERWDAEQRAAGHGGGGSIMIALAGVGEQPAEWVHAVRLWIAKPDRSRHEDDHGVRVARGRTWWSHDRLHGFMTNERDPEDGGMGDPVAEFGVNLDPARVLPTVVFESIDERDGVLVVHARSRREGGRFFFGHGLEAGADEHELHVDPTRGVVLRAESRFDGEPFVVSELFDPSFDEELADELFTLELPPGERAVSLRELHAHDLSLEEAAARASFPVFAIADLPAGDWRLRANHTRPYRAIHESVALVYHRADGRGAIVLTQTPIAAPRPPRFPGDPRAVVTVERDGTHVELASEELGEDELRALADALVRV